MRDHAYKRGDGGVQCSWAPQDVPTPPYPSTHNLGTNRMSKRRGRRGEQAWGQTHDIKNLFVSDGSQFTTGAAENPTLTIVALAMRQADFIASEMSKGNL
jgi:choline dehydrogenase-like flavoprotein